jgi:hypothetical protein
MRLDLPLLDVDTQLLLRLQKELLFGLDSVGEAKIPIHKKLRRSFDEEERASPTRIAKVNSSRRIRIRCLVTRGRQSKLGFGPRGIKENFEGELRLSFKTDDEAETG